MKTVKFMIWITILSSFILIIGYVFWTEEVKFWTPTPKPDSVKEINMGEKAPLAVIGINGDLDRPLLIHFYNPFCPCSKFNFKEFKKITSDYKGKMDFLLVAQTDKDVPNLKSEISNKFFNKINIKIDTSGNIAEEFGVYSSPQVVLVDDQGYIFYKWNYNSARYCTNKQTAYASISIEKLLNDRGVPDFTSQATTPYGCVLPSYN